MKTLYFDCFAGASGDMILGALIGLGVDRGKIIGEISKLDIEGYRIDVSTVDRSGISATKATVEVPHEHAHRHLHHIEKIINESNLGDNVKTRALKIFGRLAEAEAKVHGITVEKVHFHEVGAMDAIIDVVGACVGFELLGIEKFACSKIHVGSGFVKMAHGKFPVPPPAVAELLKDAPVYSTEIEGELITPTGAAIISTVCEEFGAIPEMKIERTAYGAGTREYKDFPNVLRLMLGDVQSLKFKVQGQETSGYRLPATDYLLLLETNIDDISPQVLGYVMERAFEMGALDCWFTAIQMKKNRPASQVSVLCSPDEKEKFLELFYRETTTLGVRVSQIERSCLPREIVKVETAFGEVDVKVARFGESVVNVKPEYEQIQEIARKSKTSLREVEKEVLEKFRNQTGE